MVKACPFCGSTEIRSEPANVKKIQRMLQSGKLTSSAISALGHEPKSICTCVICGSVFLE
jgi:hypothetical protein